MKKITTIVFTGGPGAGKTTALNSVRDYFGKRGYAVLVIRETATDLIKGGIQPGEYLSRLEFQKCLLKIQLQKERFIRETAEKAVTCEKILIVCDRGALDNKAYLTSDEYDELLSEIGKSEAELRKRYDAVFHLVSGSKGAKNEYTTENNSARTETVEEAVRLDDRLIEAWKDHSYFRVIDREDIPEKKTEHLLFEMAVFLGEE